MAGTLYGIGVGPGDPELLTLKAVRTIEQADRVIIPVKELGEKSIAFEIVKQVVSVPADKLVEVEFKMSRVKKEREAGHKKAADQIKQMLDAGENLAMVTLGDVSIYSTCSYVQKILTKENYNVEVIPGIPSFCAGAGAAKIALVEERQSLAVIPSYKNDEELEQIMDDFSSVVIMKVGNKVAQTEALLKGKGKYAVVVSNAGMEDEYIGPLDSDRDYGYFTTMIIKDDK